MLIILTVGILINFIVICFFGRFIGNKGSIVITTTLMGFNVMFCFVLFCFTCFLEKTYFINLKTWINSVLFQINWIFFMNEFSLNLTPEFHFLFFAPIVRFKTRISLIKTFLSEWVRVTMFFYLLRALRFLYHRCYRHLCETWWMNVNSKDYTWVDIIVVRILAHLMAHFANWVNLILVISTKGYVRPKITLKSFWTVFFIAPYKGIVSYIDWWKVVFHNIRYSPKTGFKSTYQIQAAYTIRYIDKDIFCEILRSIDDLYDEDKFNFDRNKIFPAYEDDLKSYETIILFIFIFFFYNRIIQFLIRILIYICLPYYLLVSSFIIKHKQLFIFLTIGNKIWEVWTIVRRGFSSIARFDPIVKPCNNKIKLPEANHFASVSEPNKKQLQESGLTIEEQKNAIMVQTVTSQPVIHNVKIDTVKEAQVIGATNFNKSPTTMISQGQNLTGQCKNQYLANPFLTHRDNIRPLTYYEKRSINKSIAQKLVDWSAESDQSQANQYIGKNGRRVELENPVKAEKKMKKDPLFYEDAVKKPEGNDGGGSSGNSDTSDFS